MKKSHLRRCAMRRMAQENPILSRSRVGGTKLSLFALLAVASIGTGTAEAACFVDPTGTINCQGTDAAGGVAYTNPPYDTLNVNSLSADVSPSSGTSGEVLEGFGGDGGNGTSYPVQGGNGGAGVVGGPVTIHHAGGVFTISPVGNGAFGIHAISRGGSGGNGGNGWFSFPLVPAFGGDGGDGKSGGTVMITSSGAISTSGDNAHGILGESIGGNGGNGGDGLGFISAFGGGGDGGDAAGGGLVDINSSSNITTNGSSSHGIFAQSTGGKGGAGGGGIGIVTEGGAGGVTAPGGRVTVTNSGLIATHGIDSFGIFAQSVGGFGGDSGSGGGLVAFGEDAASGGPGGLATVINSGTITTDLQGSHGIFAQSVGGGGGSGGSAGGLVALGSGGAAGGAGSTVTVTNNIGGHITTLGADAAGIFAQSVGGGGGDGGSGGGLIGIGGTGANTSPGGLATVTNSQAITTYGDRSRAIFAQSVGGGGGNGGMSFGVVSIGGGGGSGGNGGNVEVSNSGALSTGGTAGGTGDDATAVFLQSIGGGGGNGGASTALGLGASVAIGGSGSVGGTGGNVTFNAIADANDLTAATIETTGDRSHGIQAQSVGGGGGNGGFAFSGTLPVGGISASFALGGRAGPGGASGEVTVNEKGTVTTVGEQSIGIFAQSVGGGGGNGGGSVGVAAGGGYNLSLAIGGSGGSGGSSKLVTVNAVGDISTTGKLSHGIMAQSVGGGGGNGGYSVAASLGGFAGSVALGGGAGVGGIGNTVDVTTTGAGFVDPTISTEGEGAIGILAQSVGGGGGNGGLAGTLSVGSGAVGVSLGGIGAGGATGGAVSVANGNKVTTTGNNASAIFAQSVGGGGGNGGAALAGTGGVVGASVALGGGGGAGSNGGTVYVDNSGSITTGKAIDPNQEFGNLSYGIFAQSVGGGGGNGGFALSGAVGVSVKDIPGGAAAISIGGKGGGASDGGTVTVDNSGSIQSYGLGAHAIFAQSVGGGGGNGGFAGSVAMTIGGGAAFGVAVGGGASGGGDAGTVTVNDTDTAASIITHADGADGIHAQSVGGGGGDGGFAMSGAFGFGGEASVNVAVAIGGAGGAGGAGNIVDVTSHSAVTTYGNNANGVMAQSVGGGGGNGGLAVTGTLGLSETAGNVGVTVGGGGGIGNIARDVMFDNFGTITTYGSESIGILGQSIGGSGGNGGLALSALLTGATKNSATVGVAVGGGGGTGNSAGIVELTNNLGGEINTTGFGAHGIKGQSIGGGGGNGGMAIVAQVGAAFGSEEQATKTLNVGVAVGGAGGGGGFGNTVHVTNNDSIEVTGDTATGVIAQSIGGGGGDGGGALNAIGMLTDSTNDDSRSVVATVTVGGGGGDGNHGGAATVDNTGSITTHGVSGYGVYAQSIGGGGGIGGRANTFSLVVTDACTLPVLCEAPASTKNNFQLGVTVGGNGGGASNGGVVTVNNTGAIETFGNVSDGIYAQSIGGGGGAGGNGILGSGELLPVPVELAFIPVGSVSFYKNLQVEVGGDAGSSGNGGFVEVNNDKNIITRGSNSNAIFAQSVGGGGGVGGKAAIGATGTFGLGGAGGAAGNGGDVKVNQYGGATIETFEVASNGIFAQSIGGGGGVAGNVDRALAADISTPIPGLTIPGLNLGIGLAMGRSGGDGGDGGIVDVDVDGQIITHGDNAAGVFAQSVGGGGGVLGELGNDLPVLDLLSWQIGSAGDAGNAGLVDVNLTGSIMTAGNNATGIFAQSAGGTGTAGAVNVTLNSSILTGAVLQDGDEDRGLGSIGILAHSAAVDNANNGDITVAINSTDGVVRGGRSQVVDVDSEYIGVGIWVMDGNNNTITNNGLVTTLGGVLEGFAILGTGSDATHLGGSETVFNFGTVIGNVSLGAGANVFNNKQDAMFNTGTTVDLGAGNALNNEGTLSPGGTDVTFVTNLDGDFVQTVSGTYAIDLDLASEQADRVTGTGSADLAGLAEVNILNSGYVMPGKREYTILSGEAGVTDSGLALAVQPSAVTDYALRYPNATDAVLETRVDFAPSGLNKNQKAIGNHVNAIQRAGSSESFSPITAALFGQPDVKNLASSYDQMSPEIYLDTAIASLFSNLQFNDAMLSCRERSGDYRFVREGECRWMRLSTRRLDRDHTGENSEFDEWAVNLAGGMQKAIGGRWHAGFALSYERSNLDNDNGAESDGDKIQAGAIIKGRSDATTYSVAMSGGYGWYDTKRDIDFLPTHERAKGDQEIGFASVHARLAHAFEQGDWYLRPQIDAGITYVDLDDFSERGAGGANLDVKGHDETYVSLQPAVEIGRELKRRDGILVRPFAKVGVTHFVSGTTPEISAVFQGAPAGVSPFTVKGDVDDTFADVSLGLDVLKEDGINFRLSYMGQFSSDMKNNGLVFKVAVPF